MPSVADRVMKLIRDWEIGDGGLPAHQAGGGRARARRMGGSRGGNEFAWIEVMGEARTHSRLLGRYLALMAVAGVLAAIGVITDNPILIVGAMAVSPDLLPDLRRLRRLRRAPGPTWLGARSCTLLLGILLTWAVAAALAWGLQAVGHPELELRGPRQRAPRPRITSTTRPSWSRSRPGWRRCSPSRPGRRRPSGSRSR